MAKLYPGYSVAGVTALTVTGLPALANTAAVTGTENNNITDRFMTGLLTCQLTAAGATNSTVDVYVLHGNATGMESDALNKTRIGSILMNGTTPAIKTLSIDFDNGISPFWKLYFVNNSGAALASAAVSLLGLNPTDV